MKRTIISLGLLLITCCMSAQTFTHPWQGKRVAYFGDSITDPNVKAGNDKWWTILSEWLGIEPICYARSGRQWNDIPRQTKTLLKEHGQDVDAILIFMGTNDFNAGVPMGKWYDIKRDSVTYARNGQWMKQMRQHRSFAMCDSTYRGRINTALDELKRTYPTKQIVILTPIHRALFDRSEKMNLQPDEMWPNKLGLWFEDYVEAVRDAGRIWSVPVIDLYSISGLMPVIDEHGQFFTNPEKDRLHPNDEGYARIARTLYYQLLTLPVF